MKTKEYQKKFEKEVEKFAKKFNVPYERVESFAEWFRWISRQEQKAEIVKMINNL